MTWDSTEQELVCRLAAKCFNNPRRYKLLAEWLGIYKWNPDEDFAPFEVVLTNHSHAYQVWQYCYLICPCLTFTEQAKTWVLINESSTYPIPRS